MTTSSEGGSEGFPTDFKAVKAVRELINHRELAFGQLVSEDTLRAVEAASFKAEYGPQESNDVAR